MLRTTRESRTEQARRSIGLDERTNSYSGSTFGLSDVSANARSGSAGERAAKIEDRSGTVDPKYTTRSTPEKYPDTAEYVRPTEAEIALTTRKKHDRAAIAPTIKTQNQARQALETPTESSSSVVSKALLAVYVLIVAVIVAVVIATGITISGMTASVSALEAELALKNAEIVTASAELKALDNSATVTGQATELGMKRPTSLTEIELLPTAEPITYEARTNWFDVLCDGLSDVMGG